MSTLDFVSPVFYPFTHNGFWFPGLLPDEDFKFYPVELESLVHKGLRDDDESCDLRFYVWSNCGYWLWLTPGKGAPDMTPFLLPGQYFDATIVKFAVMVPLAMPISPKSP